MKTLFVIFLLCTIPATLLGQEAAADLNILQQKFQSFDYDGVIEMAEQALLQPERFTQEQLISIYEMKAVSHYAKAEMTQARDSFANIIKIDSLFSLDPVKTSPKIIVFYNSIREEHKYQIVPHPQSPLQQTVVHDTITITNETLGAYKKGILASLLCPGTGHLLMRDGKRGAMLTALGVATLSSAIYCSYRTGKKEEKYMSAIADADIANTYDAYNSAYKMRNAFWAAYTAVWIYSQVDLILFHERRRDMLLSLTPPFNKPSPLLLSLTVQF